MTDYTTLKILDKFESLFTKFQIDYKTMRHILMIKFTMDSRRVPTIFNDNRSQSRGNQFIKSLGIYALMGIILIPFLIGEQYLFQMSLFFGIVMFIITTSMISDFSTVLLDVRDRNILGTKPIHTRTISAAKFIHITFYLFFLTGAFTGLPLIVGLIIHGFVFFLLSLSILILVNLLILIITATIYLLVLRFFDGEKLKDMINYVQITLSIAMVVGYQLIARSFDFVDMGFSLNFQWWQVLIPPMWYGALFDLVMKQQFDQGNLILMILGIIIPVVSFLIYIKLLPSFEKNLEKLLSEPTANHKPRESWTKLWAKILCRSKEERTFFLFSSRMMKNEREFKLKVYPILGMALVFPFIFIFNISSIDGNGSFQQSNAFINMYLSFILFPSGVLMLGFSEKYKGAWIYKAAPIRRIQYIHKAALKAFLSNLFIPLYLLLSVIFLILFGIDISLFLLCLLGAGFIYAIISYRITCYNERLPFSESFKFAQQNQAGKAILLLLLGGVFVLVDFIFLNIVAGQYIYLAILIIVNIMMWKKMF